MASLDQDTSLIMIPIVIWIPVLVVIPIAAPPPTLKSPVREVALDLSLFAFSLDTCTCGTDCAVYTPSPLD